MGLVAMYWFIPRCQVRFKHALVAGVVVGIIFEILKLTFGAIVDNFTSYKAVYGAFAILPLFLLWIYISWNIILLGVQISYCLTIFETKEIFPRHALFSLMDMLNVLYREHKKGNAVTEAGLRDVLGRQEMPNWYTYISFYKITISSPPVTNMNMCSNARSMIIVFGIFIKICPILYRMKRICENLKITRLGLCSGLIP